MDIGIVAQELVYPRGAGRQVCELAYYLNKWGNDVTIYTFQKKEDYAYDYLLNDINIISLTDKWKYNIRFRFLQPINLIRWFKMSRDLAKKIGNHDIINYQAIPMNWVSYFVDIPGVWTCNEPFFYTQSRTGEGEWKYKPFFKFDNKFTKVNLILALDERMKKMIEKRFNSPVKSVGSGVSLVRQIKHKNNNYINIISVGPICYQRRQLDIINALSKLNINNLKLHLVGDIESEDLFNEIKNIAQKNGIDLCYHGVVSTEYLYNLYDIADLSIMASEIQPWGIFPLETILGYIPTITSNQIGVNEFIDNSDFVYEMGNVEELKSKISQILDNYEEYQNKTILLAKEVQDKCTWESYSKRIFKIFSKELK